jgi:hypothetical protein
MAVPCLFHEAADRADVRVDQLPNQTIRPEASPPLARRDQDVL